jgi:thiol:disulfide interchange protein
MEIPEELFTAATLFTLSGLATAVWIITSVIGYLFPSPNIQKWKKWIGLVLSFGLVIFGTFFLEEKNALTWVVAVVNAFLVYLTAVGINTVVSARPATSETRGPTTREAKVDKEKSRGRFRDTWL